MTMRTEVELLAMQIMSIEHALVMMKENLDRIRGWVR